MKMECDYLYGWNKKQKDDPYTKSSPKMVNPRNITGLFVSFLTTKQHAIVSQGRICTILCAATLR